MYFSQIFEVSFLVKPWVCGLGDRKLGEEFEFELWKVIFLVGGFFGCDWDVCLKRNYRQVWDGCVA